MTVDLISRMSLESFDGAQVPLMLDTYRIVQSAEGLAGLKARTSSRAAVGRDGTILATRYRDEKAITITGLIVDQTGNDAGRVWDEWTQIEAAFAACVDTDRLLMWQSGNLALQASVRLEELTNPVQHGPKMLAYQATLHNASGISYSQELQTAVVASPDTSGGGGLTLPFTLPFTLQPLVSAQAFVRNDGSVPAQPLLVVHGAQSSPQIVCGNRKIIIDGDIAAGDALWLNAADRTVLLNGDPLVDRRNMVRWSSSRWFSLPPKQQVAVQLLVNTFDSGAGLEVRYRNAY
jgi:hypothetical protein